MEIFRKARPEEREEILQLADHVFSIHSFPHSFKTFLPKIYADKWDPSVATDCSSVAEVDGKIRGLIACPNIPMTYAGETFTAGLIGTVAVDPDYRCRGYMRRLMLDAMKDSEARGADVLILGGLHQRYQHYGFEFAGAYYNFTISPQSAHHSWGNLPTSHIRVRPMTPEDEWMDAAFALYQKETITGMRTRENFYDACCSWNYDIFAVFSDDRFVGYFTTGKDGYPGISNAGDISELVLEDESLRNAVLKVWSDRLGRPFVMWVAAYQADRIADWMVSAERYTLELQEQICVLHWLPVLKGAMALRCAAGNAADGEAVLDLDGTHYLVSVKNGKSHVELTDRPADTAPLSGIDAIRHLFGLAAAVTPGLNILKNNWLPLPFNLPFTDKF